MEDIALADIKERIEDAKWKVKYHTKELKDAKWLLNILEEEYKKGSKNE